MTIAFLVQAHMDPHQLARLIERLHPHDVYVHLDKKTIRNKDWHGINAHFVEPRYPIYWAGFSQVEGTISTINAALESNKLYEKFVLLSGACYPIKPISELENLFSGDGSHNYIKYVDMRSSKHLLSLIEPVHLRDAPLPALLKIPKGQFINKIISRGAERLLRLRPSKWPLSHIPYHGSNWWALTPAAARYAVHELERNHLIAKTYRRTFASDEQVFHTLIGNSNFHQFATGEIPFTGRGTYKAANLHLIHPSLAKTYTIHDFKEIADSDRYFVRKVDSVHSRSLLDCIDRQLL